MTPVIKAKTVTQQILPVDALSLPTMGVDNMIDTPNLVGPDDLPDYVPFHIKMIPYADTVYLSIPLEFYRSTYIQDVFGTGAFNAQSSKKTLERHFGRHIFKDHIPGVGLTGECVKRRFHTPRDSNLMYFNPAVLTPDGPVWTFLAENFDKHCLDTSITKFMLPYRNLLQWIANPTAVVPSLGSPLEFTEEWLFMAGLQGPNSTGYPAAVQSLEDRLSYLWDRARVYSLPRSKKGMKANGIHIDTNRYIKFVLWYLETQVLPYHTFKTPKFRLSKSQRPYYVNRNWLPWCSPATLKRYTDAWALPSYDKAATGNPVSTVRQRPLFRNSATLNALERIYALADANDAPFMRANGWQERGKRRIRDTAC